MFTSRTSHLVLATLAASFAVAAPASADSVVYLKGGDVFLTTTDIARQFQVTSGGGYSAVSQADDGTILATTTAGKLRRLSPQGAVLSEVGSIAGGSSALSFKGPYDADISPNGAKLAYGYTYTGYTNTTGGTWVNEGNATAFAPADHETTSADTGYKSSREYDAPEWVDDQRVLVSNGPGYPSNPLAVVEAGSGGSRSWFTDPENTHPHDATLSRNWRMLATTNGDRNALYVYRDDDALLLGGVHSCFYYTPDDIASPRLSSPTFNADGTKLFWADGVGLEVAPIGDTRTTCPDGVDSKKVLPGGSSPDWGPADVPTARTIPLPSPNPGTAPGGPGTNPGGPGSVPGTNPGTKSGGGQTPQNGQAGGNTVGGSRNGDLSLLAGKITLRKALGSGLSITVTAPAAGKVRFAATVAGKPVASGSTTAKAAGLVTGKVKFTASAKRKLARSSKVVVTISATQGSATGSVQTTLRK